MEGVKRLEDLVNHGRYLEARELALQLKNNPEANPLRVDQLLALSLSKSGSPEVALAHLDLPYRRDPHDPETAGILGGIYKELFKKHQDSKYAILSRDTYTNNFKATNSYYTGINAATMSAIAGRAGQGREIAIQVIAILGDATKGFWELATLGEAYLLTKDRQRSIDNYVKARQLAGNDWGKVTSVYNQLWLLNHYVPVPREIMKVFSPPTVAAFIGHMVDHPSRTVPRFPQAIEGQVKDAIAGAVRAMNAGIGYCSLACGGDILFAESMEQAGAELHIFIPFSRKDFMDVSVRFAGAEWIERFERLIKKYPVTHITEDAFDGNDEIFAFQCKIIFGSAMLRSKAYHQEPMLLSVQSEMDLKRKSGGTRDTSRLWPLPQRHININPDQFLVSAGIDLQSTVQATGATTTQQPVSADDARRNRPILYLVAVELSQTPALEKEKIYKVMNTKIKDSLIPYKVFDLGTDSIFMAFDAETAAIDFVQLILSATAVIKNERNVKIGLHAAPVDVEELPSHEFRITETANMAIAHHVSHFAPLGSVCSTDHFAALLALDINKFHLDYAGVLQAEGSSESHGIFRVTIKR